MTTISPTFLGRLLVFSPTCKQMSAARWAPAFLALLAIGAAQAVCLDAPRPAVPRAAVPGDHPAYHVIRGGASNLKLWWRDASVLLEEVEEEANHEEVPLSDSDIASAFAFFAARRAPVVQFGKKSTALEAWSKATEWR